MIEEGRKGKVTVGPVAVTVAAKSYSYQNILDKSQAKKAEINGNSLCFVLSLSLLSTQILLLMLFIIFPSKRFSSLLLYYTQIITNEPV